MVAMLAPLLSGCQPYFTITRITFRNISYQLNHPIQPAPSRPEVNPIDTGGIKVSWIGHATMLINFYGTLILTDPNFSHRVGMARRIVEPALKPSELPPIDLIVISHAHFDHFNLGSLKRLPKNNILIIPRNCRDLVEGMGFTQVIELDWKEEVVVKGVVVKALRPNHWGRRTPFDDRERGYNAYILTKGGRSILFGGDTAYTKAIGDEGKGYNLAFAILPIGAYSPELWHKRHATPEEALQMFLESGAEYMIPMHWGTFILSLEPIGEPIERLKAEAQRLGVKRRILFLRPGETAAYPLEGP